ncbi:DNA polymerase phi-domain-containing protein [Collybia nuda]|uniref:DNA polymerase phi-domain-containing protein n=1 Tax=Collybia nuda TaxID=64659 RepID=A0A9P5YA09_9AGAR|nr:DNA polymerase phi-domain-containing protein [Collybia nuda]
MTTTLPLFWHLSSASKKERIDASVKLIGALEQFQAQFTPKDISGPNSESEGEDEDEEVEGAPTSDGLDALNSQDVSYSIRRLVRGLASPRESSRLGFAVALTELLSRIETVTCFQIITLIVNETKAQGSITGQEERDILFARLFGITSVIQSGLLVRTGALTASASSAAQASTVTSYEEAITQLLFLGEKKSWLRESAWWTITLAIDALEGSDVNWKDGAIDITLQHLFIENSVWSPEKVALALKLQNLHPDRDWKKYFSPSFKNPDLLNVGNLQNLARILKESTTHNEDTKDVPKASAGSWKPQLHYVWDIILDQLLPDPNSSSPPKGSFQDFYRVVVDESLFSSTSSQERKYWGFQVFQKALPRVDQNSMPMLFTKNFMRSWINHLSHRDRHLHKIATQAAIEVQSFVQNNPHLGFALILQLTGGHGSQHFDKLTKTKTVETILTSMDAEGIKSYIEYLLTEINLSGTKGKSDIQTINTRRQWIIDQLGGLIRSGAIPKSDEWVQSVLDWLTINGLFIIKKKSEKSPYRGLHAIPSPPLSDDLRQSCRLRLLSCLSDLNGQMVVMKSGNKASKVSAVASDGEFWVSKVLSTIQALEKDSKHLSLLNNPDEDDIAPRNKALEIAARLRSIPPNERQEAAKGAELLLLATALQQYCVGDHDEVDTETMEACIDGATRMFPEEKKSKKSRKSTSNIDESAPEPIDVFVDTIIGFLEKSTAYMRTVGNQVFALLSGEVQESTIDLIVTQLERRDPAELAESEGEDGDMEDDEDDEDGEEEEDDESGASGEDSDDNSGDEEADLELRTKIEEALRVNGVEAATGDSDEEEELMDDEQMMAIDEQLAEVFRSRINEKKSGKGIDSQRDATHFKNRALDLVDTFVKKQPSSPHIIRLILPMVNLIAGTGLDEKQLSDKAKGILRSRIGKSKDFPSEVDKDHALTVATALHIRARKVHSSDLLATLSQSSTYVSKILIQIGAEKSLVQIYSQSLADFITRKNSALNTNFFLDFIRRCPATAWHLRGDLLQLLSNSVNTYRQLQVFKLLEILVGQLPVMGPITSSDIPKFVTSLEKLLLELATSACEETVTLSASQLKEVLKVGLVTAKQIQRMAPAVIGETWQIDAWNALSNRLGSCHFKTSPQLKAMCEQIARVVHVAGGSVTEKSGKVTKRKAPDSNRDERPTAEKGTKRKKIKTNKS